MVVGSKGVGFEDFFLEVQEVFEEFVVFFEEVFGVQAAEDVAVVDPAAFFVLFLLEGDGEAAAVEADGAYVEAVDEAIGEVVHGGCKTFTI